MANKVWTDKEMKSIALEILDIEPKEKDAKSGYPFLTPYQIAIEFKSAYPAEFHALGLKIGGLDTKEHNSLTQQFSRMLNRYPNEVEKQYLYRCHMPLIAFSDDGDKIEPSNSQDIYLTMFRLKE